MGLNCKIELFEYQIQRHHVELVIQNVDESDFNISRDRICGEQN